MVTGRRRGFSLIETELALVLFASASLVIAGAIARSVKLLREAEARAGATAAATSVADSLTQLASPLGGSGTRGRYRLDWSVADSGATAVIVIRVHWVDGTRPRSDSLGMIAGTTPARLHVVP